MCAYVKNLLNPSLIFLLTILTFSHFLSSPFISYFFYTPSTPFCSFSRHLSLIPFPLTIPPSHLPSPSPLLSSRYPLFILSLRTIPLLFLSPLTSPFHLPPSSSRSRITAGWKSLPISCLTLPADNSNMPASPSLPLVTSSRSLFASLILV